jgi:hypothetical protein
MLNDVSDPYRWQDHVVTPRRASLNLIATALIVAVVGTAGLIGGRNSDPVPSAHVALATERALPPTQNVKRPVLTHPKLRLFRNC